MEDGGKLFRAHSHPLAFIWWVVKGASAIEIKRFMHGVRMVMTVSVLPWIVIELHMEVSPSNVI
jgi:hypothetical protein